MTDPAFVDPVRPAGVRVDPADVADLASVAANVDEGVFSHKTLHLPGTSSDVGERCGGWGEVGGVAGHAFGDAKVVNETSR